MGKLGRRALVLLLAGLSMSVIAACGGGDDSGDSGTGGSGGEAKNGGSITMSQTSQPDFMDPALTYTVNGIEPLWLVYTPLLTYPRTGDAEKDSLVVPGLAEDMPTISKDGKTYELTLRKGLKYSDGSPVKASDFEHALKRVLNLESGGSAFFLGIVGAQDYIDAGKCDGDIKGVVTDDKTGKITISLSDPDGSFTNVLAMWFVGLVPGDTPCKNLTENPPPGVGPYKVTESVPNRQFVLEKNANFPDLGPDIPAGHIDKMTTKIIKNPQRQAQDVISGELDYMQDPPPADIKPEVKAKYSDRYREITTASTYYMFMNNRVAPFDKKEVREAVNIGLDKPALARLFAGEVAPGCSFLPPGQPGFDEALDVADCPWGDPNKPPDIEKARQMIKDAGVAGTDVTVYGNNDDPSDKVTEAYADQLTKLGFKAKPKILDGGVYFQTIGSAKVAPQTGFANWFQDFPHPKNFFFLVDGKSIQPTNNQNFGNVDDPEITKGIAELNKEPKMTDEVAARWGELNKKLVERAWIVPYGHRKLATFLSERMDFDNCSRFHPVYFNDYSSFCLK
ncbi:MAG: peptide/nickel transport system substrate-binding protein [Thermoleophilaceae bacterium]|jgi:peptide/nickel transport system substrate-binding protein|nr:peptide/nickel transport system substrate-binding protein [Thermoleophilaceae bacterium]